MPANFPDRSLRERLSRLLFGVPSGVVFRGMVTLALGSSMGRVVGIAAMPVLTRLYGPEDFGVLSVFTALIAILAPLATLRYAMALPLPRHDGTAMNLLVLSGGMMLGFSAVVALLLWVAGVALLSLVSMERLAPWWWLIALGVFGTAFYELLTMWATRRRAYKVIATTNVTQSASGAIVKIGLGLLALKPLGLLLGQVFAQAGGVFSLLRGFSRDFRRNWRHVRWQRVRKVALRYRDFPMYRVPSQFLMNLSMQAPLLFVAALYDSETTGQLGLAMTAISLPIALLGRTTAKAFYAEASNCGRGRADEIKAIFVSVIFRLGAISFIPAVLLLFFGKLIFSMAFGAEWVLAGSFASILAIYLMFQFIQAPVAYVFILFDGQRALLLINVQRFFLSVLPFGMAPALTLSSRETVFAFAAALSVHYAASVYYAYRYIPKNVR